MSHGGSPTTGAPASLSHRGRQTISAASTDACLRMLGRLRAVARSRAGASAVEFAFVAPLLVLLAIGMVQLGIVLHHYLVLTEAVRDGARQLALSRGASTPYTTTVSAIQTAAADLSTSNLTIALSVNGTACTTDTTCQTALASAAGQPGNVTATYPCQFVVLGVDFMPSCTLSSAIAEMIE